MPAPELPHFEEAELETEVQRKSPMGCGRFARAKLLSRDFQALIIRQRGVSK